MLLDTCVPFFHTCTLAQTHAHARAHTHTHTPPPDKLTRQVRIIMRRAALVLLLAVAASMSVARGATGPLRAAVPALNARHARQSLGAIHSSPRARSGDGCQCDSRGCCYYDPLYHCGYGPAQCPCSEGCIAPPTPPPAPPGPGGHCGRAQSYPTGRNYLEQDARPPQQTSTQANVLQKNVRGAAAQSALAEAWLATHLDTVVRPGLTGLPCAAATAEELLAIVKWEFNHQQLIHNAPVQPGQAGIDDDTDLKTTLMNSYIQNVCQRYLLGEESKNNFEGESGIMEQYMAFPPFVDPAHPTLREAGRKPPLAIKNLPEDTDRLRRPP